MSEYNLSELSSSSSSAVKSAQDEYLGIVDNKTLLNVLNYFNPDNELDYVEELKISVNSLGDLSTLLDNSISEIASYQLPDRPSELDDEITKDKSAVFMDARLDALQDGLYNLYSVTASGGFTLTGFDTELDAYLDGVAKLNYETEKKDLEIEIDNAAIAWSADGYEEAPGALSHQVGRLLLAFDKARKEYRNTLVPSIIDTVQENIRKSYEAGLSIEKLHMEFAKRYTDFKYKKMNALIDAYVAEIEKVTREIGAQRTNIAAIVKGLQSDLYVEKKKAANDLKKNISDLKGWQQAKAIEISAEVSKVKLEVGVLQETTQAYAAMFSSYANLFSGVNIVEQAVE